MRIWRARSQAISFGVSSAAAAAPGFEKIPTVLMSGIEQELLVPFRAQDRALDDLGLESHLLHSAFDAPTRRDMLLWVANDATLPNLLPSDFKLRFDEYNHFCVRL